MPSFSQRVRLPMKITRAQFPEERTSFRKANGEVKTLSVVVRKTYVGETDYLPENWHQKLKIALSHDVIIYEGEKYFGQIAQEGDYQIEWQEFLDYPTAKAGFTVQVTPFDASNSNCQSCEEASQISLEDDTFPDPLEEDEAYELNIKANDTICCYPAVFSLTYFNPQFIALAYLDPTTHNLFVETQLEMISANGVLLATYRVTCPNGGYDEASVYGDIVGSEVGCLAPTNLEVLGVSSTTAQLSWEAPASIPVGGYDWYVEWDDNPGVHVAEGNTADTFTEVTGLTPGNVYVFYLYSVCGESNISNTISVSFYLPPESGSNCGTYDVSFSAASGDPSEYVQVKYRDCSLTLQVIQIYSGNSALFCARQTTPGNPVYIAPDKSGTTITYTGVC